MSILGTKIYDAVLSSEDSDDETPRLNIEVKFRMKRTQIRNKRFILGREDKVRQHLSMLKNNSSSI